MIKKFWVIIVLFLMCPAFVLAEQIDINSATLSQLDELTDVGPVIAQRIIDARPFFSVDDLERVKGIGPKTLQKIKDQGLACVNCATTDEKHETSDITPAGVMSEVNATYPDGIFINEILPNPEGADETDEWIVPTIRQADSAYLQ